MAKTLTQPCTQNLQLDHAAIVNATGAVGTLVSSTPGNTILLCTDSGNGMIIKGLTVFSDDTSPRVLHLYWSPDNGTTQHYLGAVSIPANAGPPTVVDILNSGTFVTFCGDHCGNRVILLPSSYRIYVGVEVAVTSGKNVVVNAMSEAF